MSSALNKEVLVLNKHWDPIDVVDVRHALSQMASHQMVGFDFAQKDAFYPVTWEEWLLLDVRAEDDFIQAVNFKVRAPRVVMAVKYAKTVMKRPKLTLKSLAERDGGRCAYTLEELSHHDRTMEHVLPKSRGGQTRWDNVVLAKKKINNRRGNKSLEEAGLTLKIKPHTPKPKTFAATLHGRIKFSEWKQFIKTNK